MSFVTLHRDKKHKYKNGFWSWQPSYEDVVDAKLKFYSHADADAGGGGGGGKGNAALTDKNDNPHDDIVGLSFTDYIDEAEERIFLDIFKRPSSFYDSSVITIQDIKNLVLFTIKSSKTSLHLRVFIEFLHTSEFDEFLHATIFYIDHFLLALEFLLIRRDEIEMEGKVKDMFSMKVERFLSKELSDRRLLMAREYSKILVQSAAHEMKNEEEKATRNSKRKKEKWRGKMTAEKDLIFFESMIDFTIQCSFIAMHRRAFNAICEFPFQISYFHTLKLSFNFSYSFLL